MSFIPPFVTTNNTEAGTQNISIPPADMQDISWVKDSTGSYDIINQFTLNGNEGNLEVIKSKILILLNVMQGEWSPVPSFGFPLSQITTYSSTPDVAASIVADQILTVQNVNQVTIDSVSLNASSRVFSANYNVNTAFGAVTVSV